MVEQEYSALLRKYPSSVEVLFSYADYADNVLNNSKSSLFALDHSRSNPHCQRPMTGIEAESKRQAAKAIQDAGNEPGESGSVVDEAAQEDLEKRMAQSSGENQP